MKCISCERSDVELFEIFEEIWYCLECCDKYNFKPTRPAPMITDDYLF